MTELLAFFSVHWFLAWCALWLAWVPVIVFVALLRSLNVLVHGCPPAGLDEDGDRVE